MLQIVKIKQMILYVYFWSNSRFQLYVFHFLLVNNIFQLIPSQ